MSITRIWYRGSKKARQLELPHVECFAQFHAYLEGSGTRSANVPNSKDGTFLVDLREVMALEIGQVPGADVGWHCELLFQGCDKPAFLWLPDAAGLLNQFNSFLHSPDGKKFGLSFKIDRQYYMAINAKDVISLNVVKIMLEGEERQGRYGLHFGEE
ncbi:MAG TPA: hypothetical protein VK395_32505 [Gemmataceae bacterium]|nr:hypothetical protein [Gemmataceae bacterium]